MAGDAVNILQSQASGRTGRAGAKGTAIALVEAHDFEMVGRVSRYTEEPLKPRVIDALRPKNKTPKVPPKKKKAKTKENQKLPKTSVFYIVFLSCIKA